MNVLIFWLRHQIQVIASLRLETAINSSESGHEVSCFTQAFGTMHFVKPNLAASLMRDSTRGTERSSPESPISPNAISFSSIGLSFKAETIDNATLKSAAGSSSLIPPTMFT